MKLIFDPDFDQGAWPGPLGVVDGETALTAVAGAEWVGEAGLLGRLETALGLGGRAISNAERAATIVPAVLERDGFWSASAAVDPFGTARRLLELRDALALRGWRAEPRPALTAPLTPWLAALAAVTAGAPVGVPDRLSAVAQSLARRRADLDQVRLLCAIDELAPLWRSVLNGLVGRGTRVHEVQHDAVPPSMSDLHASRGTFSPRGDGSLQLVRPYGPMAAADSVAAWLSAFARTRAGLSAVVIVGTDAVLDAALHRHGLPTAGAAALARENLLLQIVPLVLALGWRPVDPHRALELLTLPVAPVPQPIARRLARALHEWPAVDSDAWREALAAGLAEIPEGRRPSVTARLETLLVPTVERGTPYPVHEIERRFLALDAWLRGRQSMGSTVETDSSPSLQWQAPLDQIAAARRLLTAARFESLSAAQLQWLIETATGSIAVPPMHAAEAGLATVGSPGAVAGPARVIVWWRFLLDSATRVRRLPLAPADRAALAAAGIELQDPGREALYLSQRWRRPLLQAREHLLLITPWRGNDGEEAFTHPLWDEVAARVPSKSALAKLIHPMLQPSGPLPLRLRQGVSRALPRPRRAWSALAQYLVPREWDSPTSLSSMLGCSFQWTLENLGGLRAGETASLPEAAQLSGSLAHHILEMVLTAPPGSGPGKACAEAQRLFDEIGPRLAATLFLPGADDTRAEARRVIGAAASALAELLETSGMRVLAAETEVVAGHGPWKERLRGRPDLVLGPAPAILDLKWGGAPYHRSTLVSGTALQLAAYSMMVRPGETGPLPPVAYFVLKQQRLLSTDAARFPGAERVDGPGPGVTWDAFERAHAALWQQMKTGALVAPGNSDTGGDPWPSENEIVDGTLVLTPPCRFCDLGALCGRVFAGDQR